MTFVCRCAYAAVVVLLLTAPTSAQQAQQSSSSGQGQTPQKPAQDPKPAAPEQKPAEKPQDPNAPPQPPKYEETVVVSASRTEEKLVNAPATMTVIGEQMISTAPTQNFAELLRSVPGLNITQISARDINLTSRSATGTLATGTLALLDGRTLYQDFFGFVMWDFLPVNLDEIKQVEVIRGPASAVWGANAVNGVVNVITKSPREIQGTSVTAGLGTFERGVEDGPDVPNGSLVYFGGTHAAAISDRWAFKIAGGGYSQDPLTRPTGIIPGSPPPGTSYPPYRNEGTTQPKFDGRLDYDYENGARLSFSGGAAGTRGIMHSGIGPFDIKGGSVMSYGKADYSRQGFKATFFTNILNGDASNLLSRDVNFQPIEFEFNTKTYDFDVSNVQTFASRHVVNYGGNLRFNNFDLSLAPEADNRTEFGVYAQDEIFINDHFRWVIGARVDRFDFIDDFVFAPRTTLMIKPQENHTFRVSYNRAYKSPSVINNHLQVTIIEPINLGLFSPALAGRVYPLPITSTGNTELTESTLDAYEVGYSGVVGGRTVLSAAFYVNRTKNEIFFTELTSQRYTATNPPPGWPLPPAVIAAVPGGSFPAAFTYLNFGKVEYRGVELGVETSINPNINVFGNYSFQAEPEPEGFALSELNLPPENRFNVGVGFNYARALGNLSITYTDSAFWQDVLDARFSGTTDAYTLVNGGVGLKWMDGQLTTSVKVINLLNEDVQQHVFGDVLKRQIVGELKVKFPQ